MHSLEETCKALRELADISRPKRGVQPGFSKSHVYLILAQLTKTRMSRVEIEEKLSIGEASAKTLVKRLKEKGYVVTSKHTGTSITDQGKNLIKPAISTIRIVNPKCNVLTGNDKIIMVETPNPPRTLMDVHKIRDYLVKSGCDVSIICGYKEGALSAPGIDYSFAVKIEECIPFMHNDFLIIITYEDNILQCLDGVISYLLSVECKPGS